MVCNVGDLLRDIDVFVINYQNIAQVPGKQIHFQIFSMIGVANS